MRKSNWMKVTMMVAVGACIASCDSKKSATPDQTEGYMGMYEAVLPCADCGGIRTFLTLNADSTAATTQLYYDSDGTSATENGKWSYKDSIFTVNSSAGEQNYKLLPDTSLVMINKENPTINMNYKLTKATPMTATSFAGTYVSGDDEKGSYEQTMTIAPLENNEVEVSIQQTGGAGKGCDFKAKGHIVNNQIEINLHDVNDKMNSTMVIYPINDGKGLNVFTSKFDDRYDLQFFCGGGGSLAGDYTKVEK